MTELVSISTIVEVEPLPELPVKKRRMTDIIFALLFFAQFGFVIYGFSHYYDEHGPEKLITARDWEGNFCGIDRKFNSNGMSDQFPDNWNVPFRDYNYAYFSLNLNSVLTDLTDELFTDEESGDTYFQDTIERARVLLNPVNMLGSEESGLNAMLKMLDKFFVPVCMRVCPLPDLSFLEGSNSTSDSSGNPSNIEDIDEQRSYIWKGPLGLSTDRKREKWLNFVRAAEAYPESGGMELFTFPAMSYRDCPYSAEKCVRPPLLGVKGFLGRYCVPIEVHSQYNTENESYEVDSDQGEGLPEQFTSAVGGFVSGLISDINEVKWTILMVVGITFVIDMTYLILVRLLTSIILWLSILLIFLISVAGGVVGFLYSNKCGGEPIQTTVTTVFETWDTFKEAFLGRRDCSNYGYTGFTISNNTGRDASRYASYVLVIIGFLYLLLVFFLRKRIRLGVAVTKVAAQFLSNNFSIILLPLVQFALLVSWFVLWLAVSLFVLSAERPGDEFLDTIYTSRESAESDCAFSITPVATQSEIVAQDITYSGDEVTMLSNTWKCVAPRYRLDYMFWLLLLSFLWVNSFIIAWGQMTIAGAVSNWYFTPNNKKGGIGIWAGIKYLYISIRYHSGTLAVGSLILSIVQFFKWYLIFISKNLSQLKSKYLAPIAWVASFVVWICEKVIKFLNKNAFIQTAIYGTGFWKSAKSSFTLIVNNGARIASLALVGRMMRWIGLLFIMTSSVSLGYLITLERHEDTLTSVVGPIIIYVIISYCIGVMVTNILSISIDTVLHCFVADEAERRRRGLTGVGETTPILLKKFLN